MSFGDKQILTSAKCFMLKKESFVFKKVNVNLIKHNLTSLLMSKAIYQLNVKKKV